jgi:hypothetical protein
MASQQTRLSTAALAALLMSMPFAQQAQAASATAPDEQTLNDAYIYLLGRALVVRQETNDLKAKGVRFNAIKYNPLGSADFVNPNFDVAYLEAWFAVDERSAVVLEVPDVKDRYYTAQILDEWGEVIANINERIMPSKPSGKFALVTPGSTARLGPDATPIYLHSNKAKMLARVELKGDPEGATKLQHAIKVTTIGKPRIAAPPNMASFTNRQLIGVEIFDNVEKVFASALDVAPNAAQMQEKVRAISDYVASGSDARAAVAEQLKTIAPRFQEEALTKSAPYINHWLCGASGGNYGADYRQRTAANYTGIWANNPGEVVYFAATRDADEKPLDGSGSYIMHFPAAALPDQAVDGYWSVILVGVPDYRVVPNDLKRYNFNTYSGLKKEADGSLKIGIGPKPVDGIPEENWLPSAEGKPFSLTFRTYVPKEAARRCEWTPAAVTRQP